MKVLFIIAIALSMSLSVISYALVKKADIKLPVRQYEKILNVDAETGLVKLRQ